MSSKANAVAFTNPPFFWDTLYMFEPYFSPKKSFDSNFRVGKSDVDGHINNRINYPTDGGGMLGRPSLDMDTQGV